MSGRIARLNLMWICALALALSLAPERESVRPLVAQDVRALQSTVMLPSLQAPLPPNENAIYCATLDLAWQRIRQLGWDVTPSGVGDLLDRSEVSPDDFAPQSYTVTAGRLGDASIQEALHQLPGAPTPQLPAVDDTVVASPHVNVQYKLPYSDEDHPLEFHTSDGRTQPVRAWGLHPALANPALWHQLKVLFYEGNEVWPESFAVDPCVDSQPYQVVLAMIPPPSTLDAGIEYVCQRSGHPIDLGEHDSIVVPEQGWLLYRDWSEVCSKNGLELARQSVQFQMDKNGVSLVSFTIIVAKSIPLRLVFNRPFLVYMQKRGASHPIFAMWVANAELLQKF